MKFFQPVLLTAALCLPAPTLLAASERLPATQDETEQAVDPADAIEDLIDEFDEAMNEFWELYRAAETDEARSEIYRDNYPDAEVYGARIWLLVAAQPDHEAVPGAVAWMLDSNAAGEYKQKCLSLLIEHHLDSDDLGDICTLLSRDPDLETERFLRTTLQKSAEATVKGKATYALCGVLASRLEIRAALADLDEEERDSYAEYYGEELVILVMDMDLEAVAAEREKLLVEVRDKYGDVKTRRGTLGAAAEGQLFELHRLQIGMVAPDIVGPDLDGVEFKLSEYRGKVVFIDFWGDW